MAAAYIQRKAGRPRRLYGCHELPTPSPAFAPDICVYNKLFCSRCVDQLPQFDVPFNNFLQCFMPVTCKSVRPVSDRNVDAGDAIAAAKAVEAKAGIVNSPWTSNRCSAERCQKSGLRFANYFTQREKISEGPGQRDQASGLVRNG